MKKVNVTNEAKSTIAYVIASLLTKGIAFITIPIFTRLMPTNEIGKVNLYNSWFSIVYVFSTLSLVSGGYQVALNKFKSNRKEYVSSILFLIIIITLGIDLIYFIFSNSINTLIVFDNKIGVLFLIGLMTTPAMDLWLAKEKYEYKYKAGTLVSIISAIIATVFSIYMVKKINNSAEVRLLTNFSIIYGINFIVLIYLICSGKKIYNKEYWIFSLNISIPMIAYSLSAQILNASDRIMINSFVGTSEAGIYGTIYTVCTIPTIIWNALNASFVPYLHSYIKNEREKIQKKATEIFSIYSVLVIMVIFMAPEIIKIFTTEEYYGAITLVPSIVLGILFLAISNLYSNILLYYQKSKIVMWSSIIAAIVNIILNVVCIQAYGYKAAAYTTLISYICLALFQVLYVKYKKIGIDEKCKIEIYNNNNISRIIIICIMLSILGKLLYNIWFVRYIIILLLLFVSLIIFIKRRK